MIGNALSRQILIDNCLIGCGVDKTIGLEMKSDMFEPGWERAQIERRVDLLGLVIVNPAVMLGAAR